VDRIIYHSKFIDLENFHEKGFLDFASQSRLQSSDAITAREESVIKALELADFDSVTSITGSPSKRIISMVVKDLIKFGSIPELKGIGVEMGAGLGILSCEIINNFPLIEEIYAIEACKPYAERGINLTAKLVLQSFSNKVIPCHGTFNEIPIRDESIDFIIQIESLHHAERLTYPIVEGFRILKKNGYFISIDRSWIDFISDNTIEEMLNHKYEDKWLEQKGFDPRKIVTRRDNGEHEYRDKEWKDTFVSAGFKNMNFLPIHPKVTLKFILKRIITILKLSPIFGLKIPSRSGLIRGVLAKFLHINPTRFNAQLITEHPRPLVVSVWQK
jgi:ubiquinone/menaquinone biosynthesis C-methylase UbiE